MTALPDPRQGRRDQLKVMLAIGGWTDSTGSKYSDLVSDAAKRAAFAASAVAFLRRHNFRGLQVDWNYPKCWHSDCRKGPASDKPNFSKLIQVSATARSSDSLTTRRPDFEFHAWLDRSCTRPSARRAHRYRWPLVCPATKRSSTTPTSWQSLASTSST